MFLATCVRAGGRRSQNDSLATLLARLEGILGPVPRWMVHKGRYAHRYYTRRCAGAAVEAGRRSPTRRARADPTMHWRVTALVRRAFLRCVCSGQLYEKNAATERYELLTPKRTSLRHRVPDADPGLLHFISYLLHVDPHKRPTALQALQHPWIAQAQYDDLA